MLSCGTGLRILGGLHVVSCMGRPSSVFGGICSMAGKWFELRIQSLHVVDVYKV